jgi:hypothetical protein
MAFKFPYGADVEVVGGLVHNLGKRGFVSGFNWKGQEGREHTEVRVRMEDGRDHAFYPWELKRIEE